jgi:hypothetical protein
MVTAAFSLRLVSVGGNPPLGQLSAFDIDIDDYRRRNGG